MVWQLTDSSLGFEEENSGALGRGFRCGFLGMLHLEIITERLRREFNLELIITSPSIPYKIIHKNDKEEIIYNPNLFPDHGNYKSCFEPMVNLVIIVPSDYVSIVSKLLYNYEGEIGEKFRKFSIHLGSDGLRFELNWRINQATIILTWKKNQSRKELVV
jgi:GTP-binding protein LepA